RQPRGVAGRPGPVAPCRRRGPRRALRAAFLTGARAALAAGALLQPRWPARPWRGRVGWKLPVDSRPERPPSGPRGTLTEWGVALGGITPSIPARSAPNPATTARASVEGSRWVETPRRFPPGAPRIRPALAREGGSLLRGRI